jgi:hypothetical protein
MKVKELIEKLNRFNPEAETSVIVNNQPELYSITFGGPEGSTKENCEDVNFYVDHLCSNEVMHGGK